MNEQNNILIQTLENCNPPKKEERKKHINYIRKCPHKGTKKRECKMNKTVF